MGLKRLAEKTANYKERLARGEADLIKPRHVEKTLLKLRKKRDEIEAEIAAAKTPDKLARLRKKHEMATQQIAHAQWLLAEIADL